MEKFYDVEIPYLDADATAVAMTKIHENDLKFSKAGKTGSDFLNRNVGNHVAIGFGRRDGETVAVMVIVENPTDWLVTSPIKRFNLDFDMYRNIGDVDYSYIEITTANSTYSFEKDAVMA